MDNLSLILLISLVASVNTLIVITAVRLIYKVKADKHVFAEQIKKEMPVNIPKAEPDELERKNVVRKMPEVKVEEKLLPNKEEKQSKFLKYTANGYINPKNDFEIKQHIWR